MLRWPCSCDTHAMRGRDFAATIWLGNGALSTCSKVKDCWACAGAEVAANRDVKPESRRTNRDRAQRRVSIVLLQSPGCCAVTFSRETLGSVSGPDMVRKRVACSGRAARPTAWLS